MTASKTRTNVRPMIGRCYLVPIEISTPVFVVVAATNGKGAAFGYFFKGKSPGDLNESYFSRLDPKNAFLRHQFGDFGICRGEWNEIGRVRSFTADAWPMPPFIQRDEAAGIAFINHYDPGSFRCIKQQKIGIDDPSIAQYPDDSLWGHKLAETKIGRLLACAETGPVS